MIRILRFALFFALTASGGQLALAGIMVGNGVGNDKINPVKAVIDVYNANNDPDLPTDIAEFKKTDDDASFVFNPTNNNNGFSFFADLAMTIPVTSDPALQALNTAYFTYTGPQSIRYYSVKASNAFTLYTFMPGKNILELDGAGHQISHVTFWNGPPVPEPAALLLTLGTIAALAIRRQN